MPPCTHCGKEFANAGGLRKHIKTVHHLNEAPEPLTCHECGFDSPTLLGMQSHCTKQHGQKIVCHCVYCNRVFLSKNVFNQHVSDSHGLPVFESANPEQRQNQPSETAFRGNLKVYKLRASSEKDLLQFFVNQEQEIKDIVEENTNFRPQKVQLTIQLSLTKPNPDEENVKQIDFYACSDMITVYNQLNDEQFHAMIEQMMNNLVNFASNGSGWILEKILEGELKLASFSPIKGSSYLALPADLNSEASLLNIRNIGDHKCFLYSFVAWHHINEGEPLVPPGSNWRKRTNPCTYSPRNPRAHQPVGEYDMPMPLNQIDLFEKENSVNVNVFR